MAAYQAESSGKKINRRQFLKKISIGAAALGLTNTAPGLLKNASAAGRDYILIGQPAPLTGPLSGFGEPTLWMKEMAEREINKNGGIYVKSLGKKLPVKIDVQDTRSDPTEAGEIASRMILGDKVDLIAVMHTNTTADPVTGICERHGAPCLALVSPLDSFIKSGPHKWAFRAFWGVTEDIIPIYTGMWEQIPTNKKVGFLYSSDPDAVIWSSVFKGSLQEKGYSLVDLGLFPPGLSSFEGYISAWKKQKVEIISGNLTPQDWITCWRQCYRMRFKPKIATVGRAVLFPSALEDLGPELGVGLSTELWWSPNHPYQSSRTGMTSQDLAETWTRETGRQWTQTLGYEYALYELAEDVFMRSSSLDKEAIRRSIAQTDLTTIVGPIKFNAENYCRTPVVGCQWVKGKDYPFDVEIVYNDQYPQIPRTADLKPL